MTWILLIMTIGALAYFYFKARMGKERDERLEPSMRAYICYTKKRKLKGL